MVEPKEFFEIWRRLCSRFGRVVDTAEAIDYLAYLDERLTPAQISGAARSLWATREYFPRPVDFVLAAYAGTLGQLRRAAILWRENERADWITPIGGVGSLAQRVVAEIGGIHEVAGLLDRGARALREEVEARLHEVLALDGQKIASVEFAKLRGDGRMQLAGDVAQKMLASGKQ